jgi:glycerophosphoryl diester phosphodiesterase
MSTHASHQPKDCLIFAHRGANTEAMENTRHAFDKALAYAIDGIETDAQLSRDEVVVLWHDRFLNKLGLADKHIDDFDYDELKSLDFPQTGSEGIMTLHAFLDAYRTRCRLVIEVKNRDWEPVSRHGIKIQKTLDLIGQNNDQRIFVSSFNLESLMYAHHYKPEFPLIYNFEIEQTIADAQQVLTAQSFLHGLCLPIETLNQAMVDLLRERNKCIAVYTCNSDEEINKALQLGVDILISDVPHKALMIRNQ